MTSAERLSTFLRPAFNLGHRRVSTFHLCGYVGLTLAAVLSLSLADFQGLSLLVQGGVIVLAVLTFFGLAIVTKVTSGGERLVYYHHEIAILLLVTGYLWLLDQPVLPYLDLAALGLGAFLFCGRLGCFMVGCCHGRPSRWGVCYRHEHAEAGFVPYLVGIRLFPVQALESIWVLAVVVAGSVMILLGYPPGTALAWYLSAYGLGRFTFEFLRGDGDRPYRWGFSEAQWTSLLLMLVAVTLGIIGLVPGQPWHLLPLGVVALSMVLATIKRRLRGTDRHRLGDPRYLNELARVLNDAIQTPAPGPLRPAALAVQETSLGLQISANRLIDGENEIHVYGLSQRQDRMTGSVAQELADLILSLKHPAADSELFESTEGVYHLLIRA